MTLIEQARKSLNPSTKKSQGSIIRARVRQQMTNLADLIISKEGANGECECS